MNVEKKTIFLGVILFCIIIYIAVSTYGLIVDQFDETVFMIEEGETKIIEGPVHSVINTIKKNLFNTNKTKEPISTENTKDKDINNTKDNTKRMVTLKGRVLYENGIPVPDLVVELQSEPRYTTTDSNGTFIFGNVEEGKHTISLYKDGLMVGRCEFIISFEDDSLKASYEMLSDGTMLFVLPNNEMYLSFDIELKNAGGIEIKPSVEVQENGLRPRRKDVPLTVKDEVDGEKFENESEVNIFGDKKLLAPGFSGQYSFRIDNTKNNKDIDCVISLNESQPKGADIPIKYRLQVEGQYVKGDDNFYDLEEMNGIRVKVLERRSERYILEWKWVETPDDTKHARFGGQEYTLTIGVIQIEE